MPTRPDMTILREMCSLPTAPFAEGRVIEYVVRFVADRRGLKLTRDDSGNLLVSLAPRSGGKRGRRPPARWVFEAHMDHPGFVAERMIGDGRLEAAFRGFVASEFVRGAKVRFFADGDREITGTVESVEQRKDRPTPERAIVRVQGDVPRGAPGMFDQGEARTQGARRFLSRAIDNLAGAAAALTMLDELHRKPPASPLAVMLTRGEEEGFIGAIAACLKPELLRKTDRVVAIECSAMQPYAPQGAGAIIRVGDRTSIFHSGLTFFLTQQAEDLAKRDKSFKYQRALMPGGTCEATVFDVYGYTASSICVPLGNYHNMDRAKKRIGPEYIDLDDWRNMVQLFLHVARNGQKYEGGHEALKARVEKRYQAMKKHL